MAKGGDNKKLKHKSSEVYSVVDLENGNGGGMLSFGSAKSLLGRGTRPLRRAGSDGMGADLFDYTRKLSHSSGSSTTSSSTSSKIRRVAISIGGVLGALLVVELIVVIGFMARPTIGAMSSLKNVLDDFGGYGEPGHNPKVNVMLNIDTGGNLTNILGDPSGLMQMGAQLLAPTLAPSATPLEVKSVTETTLPAAEEVSEFHSWCVAASCSSSSGVVVDVESKCRALDADLLTASKNGAPVIPLPARYCGALKQLSEDGCLCDGSGLAAVSSDTSRLVSMAQVSGAMCGLSGIRSGGGC